MTNHRRLPVDQPRIMGLETEYMVHPNTIPLETSTLEGYFRNPTSRPTEVKNFLSNGARFYIDYGMHPEYATPECLTGRSVALASKAGEKIVAAALRKPFAKHLMQHDSKPGLYKRTLANGQVAVADHENYYIESIDPSNLAYAITPHLVSRIIFSGSGWVDDKGQYMLDQRAQVMSDQVFAAGSTESLKPFILNRDQPHSKTGYRLQVLSGSANMLSAPVSFRFDSTSLVIRMYELGLLPDHRVWNPGNAIRKIADERFGDNLQFRKGIRIGNRILTAAQIQLEYASIAKVMANEGVLNEYDAAFAELWYDMACDAADGKLEKWSKSIDWMAKLALIHKMHAKKGSSSVETMRKIDLAYHELPVLNKTVHSLLEKSNITEEKIPDEEINKAIFTAPDNTRARNRSVQVRLLAKMYRSNNAAVVGIDWGEWQGKTVSDTGEVYVIHGTQSSPYND